MGKLGVVMVKWGPVTVCLVLILSIGWGSSSCSDKTSDGGEILERYLSLRSVLAGALNIPRQIEDSLKRGSPRVQEEILSQVEEGERIIQSLRNPLREYRNRLERASIDADLMDILHSQSDLLESCANELETYLSISGNLARAFPFRSNPAILSFALEQLNESWKGVKDCVQGLKEGEERLKNRIGKG